MWAPMCPLAWRQWVAGLAVAPARCIHPRTALMRCVHWCVVIPTVTSRRCSRWMQHRGWDWDNGRGRRWHFYSGWWGRLTNRYRRWPWGGYVLISYIPDRQNGLDIPGSSSGISGPVQRCGCSRVRPPCLRVFIRTCTLTVSVCTHTSPLPLTLTSGFWWTKTASSWPIAGGKGG